MSLSADEHRCFGKRDGLERRLAMWAQQLSTDKRYPWVGLGLIDDLKCASRELGGDPNKRYPDMRKSPHGAAIVEGPISTHGQPPQPEEQVYDL